jgi:hypothetical protein
VSLALALTALEHARGQVFQLLPLEAEWRYNQTQNLDAQPSWNTPAFDDHTWPQGKALLYVETAALPAPKNTPLTLGRTTYYFRTTFTVPASLLFPGVTLTLKTDLDDGAYFWLNGTQLADIGMQGRPAAYATLAGRTVGDATTFDTQSLPVEEATASRGLRAGLNVLAVEVHQASTGSSDIVFGASLELSGVGVPEPAGFALCAGLGLLVFAGLRARHPGGLPGSGR